MRRIGPRFHSFTSSSITTATHDVVNTALTRETVRSLDKRGYVYGMELDVAWDAELDQPSPDRYIEGTCPYCLYRRRQICLLKRAKSFSL